MRRKPKNPLIPLEKDIKRGSKDFLALNRIITWAYLAGIGGVSGFPDRFGILPDGRFLGIEVKVKGRKLSPHQELVLAQINAAGGLGFMATSVQDVQDALEGAGYQLRARVML